MVTSGIILTSITGYLFINCISTCFSQLEKIGLSFLSGIAIQTFGMLLLDFVSIPLTTLSVLSIQLVTLLACIGIIWKTGRLKQIGNLSYEKAEVFRGVNLLWLLFIVGIVFLEYMNFNKCLYFPPFDRDSLAGFETIGYVTAQDHTLKGNILYNEGYNLGIHQPGSYISYTPMVSLSYAYLYILGAINSKPINAFMYLFFLIALYGAGKRMTTRTGAAAITFFTLMTPEMLSFSSLSATNVIQTVYVGLGVIYAVLWFKEKDTKFLYLSAFLMAANLWSRSEGILFIGAILIIGAGYAYFRKNWNALISFTAISISPLVIWTLFTTIYGLRAEGIIITYPFWDAGKANLIIKNIWELLQITEYYGWTFIAFGIGILSNIWYLIRKKDNLPILLIFILSLLFYGILLYQIDYKWDSIENVLSYSAKRFLFCFVPLAWIYFFSNQLTVNLLKKLDDFLDIKKQDQAQDSNT